MARVAIDARISRSWSSGIGVYTLRLLEALAKQPAGYQYLLLTSRRADRPPLPAGVESVAVPYAPASIGQHLRLPRAIRAFEVDALVSTHPICSPLFAPCPRLVFVHDLIPLAYPRSYGFAKRLYYRTVVRRSLLTAARVLVDSESTRRDCERLLGVPVEKMRVVYGGVGEQFVPRNGRRNGSTPYVLYVGNKRPHKNVDRLIEAFALLRREGDFDGDLVIAGRDEAGDIETDGRRLRDVARRLGLNGCVRFVGEVPAGELPALYGGAEAFAYLSSYEGFGLPPLEAMACGTPVIALDRSSLPEVVGDAGILLESAEPAVVARRLRALLADRSLRVRLSERGERRARAFTWEKAARAVADEIDAALEGGV